jgi:hypothetical protein
MEVEDDLFFVETFTSGLTNEGMKRELIALHPINPLDCKEKALVARKDAINQLRFTDRVVHASAWWGLRSTGDDADDQLQNFVRGQSTGGKTINSMFGREEGDQQVRDNESEDTNDFWEEIAALTATGKFGRCWGCDSEDHLKNQCPLRREGLQGRNEAMRNQKRHQRGASFQ